MLFMPCPVVVPVACPIGQLTPSQTAENSEQHQGAVAATDRIGHGVDLGNVEDRPLRRAFLSGALQAAGEADDALLGSAILAHAAFIPGWVGHRDETANRMRAARTYARRGPASAEFLAWLDAVEAECETISGRTREALRLIDHAESVMAAGSQYASPDWFTWFSPARLAAFKGNTQLKAGHLPQAKETLQAALNDPSVAGNRGRSVILGDLAAVEAAQHNPEAACAHAEQALELLGTSWYATGMDRVLDVRKALQPDAELECVQRLDDLLYGWQATLSTLQRYTPRSCRTARPANRSAAPAPGPRPGHLARSPPTARA